MIGLGRPATTCAEHIHPLPCCGRMGIDLSDLDALKAAAHPGCARCGQQDGRLRIVRECGRSSCYGRYRVSSYDELHLPSRAVR